MCDVHHRFDIFVCTCIVYIHSDVARLYLVVVSFCRLLNFELHLEKYLQIIISNLFISISLTFIFDPFFYVWGYTHFHRSSMNCFLGTKYLFWRIFSFFVRYLCVFLPFYWSTLKTVTIAAELRQKQNCNQRFYQSEFTRKDFGRGKNKKECRPICLL